MPKKTNLKAKGIEPVEPTLDDMQELMGLIYAIKAGDTSAAIADTMRALAEELVSQGAQAIVAGCTEIPLVLDDSMLDVPLISSTDVLAEKTVQLAVQE